MKPSPIKIDEFTLAKIRREFPSLTSEQASDLWDYCVIRNLSPFSNHVYPTFDNNGCMRPAVSIVGLRHTAHSSGEFAGKDAPVFGPETTIRVGQCFVTGPEWCSVTVYRATSEGRYPSTATERLAECITVDMAGQPTAYWKRRPAGQLAVRAEAQALRMTFSNCDGYTQEEMEFGASLVHATETNQKPRSAAEAAIAGFAAAASNEELTAVSAKFDEACAASAPTGDEFSAVVAAFNDAQNRINKYAGGKHV